MGNYWSNQERDEEDDVIIDYYAVWTKRRMLLELRKEYFYIRANLRTEGFRREIENVNC